MVEHGVVNNMVSYARILPNYDCVYYTIIGKILIWCHKYGDTWCRE